MVKDGIRWKRGWPSISSCKISMSWVRRTSLRTLYTANFIQLCVEWSRIVSQRQGNARFNVLNPPWILRELGRMAGEWYMVTRTVNNFARHQFIWKMDTPSNLCNFCHVRCCLAKDGVYQFFYLPRILNFPYFRIGAEIFVTCDIRTRLSHLGFVDMKAGRVSFDQLMSTVISFRRFTNFSRNSFKASPTNYQICNGGYPP